MVITGRYNFEDLNDSEFIRILTFASNDYYYKFGEPIIISCNKKVSISIRAYFYFYLEINCYIFKTMQLDNNIIFINDEIFEDDEYVLGDSKSINRYISNKYRSKKLEKLILNYVY